HRDVADAVLLGEVVCGRQAVSAAADDDDLIARPRRWLAPGQLPGAVAEQRVPGESEGGISLHARRLAAASGGAKPAAVDGRAGMGYNRPRSISRHPSMHIDFATEPARYRHWRLE